MVIFNSVTPVKYAADMQQCSVAKPRLVLTAAMDVSGASGAWQELAKIAFYLTAAGRWQEIATKFHLDLFLE